MRFKNVLAILFGIVMFTVFNFTALAAAKVPEKAVNVNATANAIVKQLSGRKYELTIGSLTVP